MQTSLTSKSESISILVLGFGFLILLLSLFAYMSHTQMQTSCAAIQGSTVASDKMDVVVRLIETARTRSRLTLQMSYETDPFKKDEMNMSLERLATQFSIFRTHLIELGLNDQESAYLQNINQAAQQAQMLLRQAADVAMLNDTESSIAAQRMMIEKVYPQQSIIIDNFMSLLDYQKAIIFEARKNATTHYEKAQKLQAALFVIILLLALLVAFYVIRRSTCTERELFLEKEIAQITLRSVGDAIITTSKDGRVEYLNPVAEKITGYITEDVKGKPITQVYKAYDEKNQRWLADCIIDFLIRGSYSMPSNDIILYNADDDIIDISQTIALIQDESNHVLGTITTFQDISKEKLLAKHIEHQARHDPLTGLLNRREFETKVVQSLTLYSEGTTHALCVMDLDRFKIVNDTLGHAAGDELLKQISQKIKAELRQTDLLARIGGDEFALFLSNINTRDAEVIAEKILDAIREYQFVLSNKAFRVGASIGLVDAPAQVSNYENLYHAADTACYMAKHSGRDRVHTVTYDDKNVSEKREQTQWVNRINDALNENRFTLYAQDICSLSDTPAIPAQREILIRMIDEYGELIPPMAFIPPAERYDLMPKIDDWVVRNVVAQMKRDNSNTLYAINLSGQSLADKKCTAQILSHLADRDINPCRLCFEITETSAIANLNNATEFLKALQALGCLTALDDFGSGLSSFAYLRNLPINYLKIDGMFVKQIAEDKTARVMVEAIHSIGHSMGLKTIAEFVENEATERLLKQMNIDFAQGYYYGKPQPLNQQLLQQTSADKLNSNA